MGAGNGEQVLEELAGDERLVVEVAAALPAGAHPFEIACSVSGAADRHLSVKAVQMVLEDHHALVDALRAERGQQVEAALKNRHRGADGADRAGGVEPLAGAAA